MQIHLHLLKWIDSSSLTLTGSHSLKPIHLSLQMQTHSSLLMRTGWSLPTLIG